MADGDSTTIVSNSIGQGEVLMTHSISEYDGNGSK
jgi:hypothetical protein